MSEVDSAVILAAGRGARLKPYTDSVPKTLVPVCGKPILKYILDALHSVGVRHFLIAAGYRADDFKSIEVPPGCSKEIVVNHEWESSGSMLSLNLCGEFLSRGCYIAEGDCCFDARLFENRDRATSKSLWYAHPFEKTDDGCTVWPDAEGRVGRFTVEKRGGASERPGAWKSCGVLRLSRKLGTSFHGWLKDALKAGRRDECYDLILAGHLAEADIWLAQIGSAPWQEIDNAQDLERAEALFGRAL